MTLAVVVSGSVALYCHHDVLIGGYHCHSWHLSPLQIYTQMSKILGKVFFPSGNPALQALSFWGVFFIGYISRPAGAVLFGHLGDTRGRGMCLLISVLVMGIPTVSTG
jgi:MFS family permease